MNAQELLSEDESARRAGVSISTLRQFADFGFLSRLEENGEGRYRLNDLVSVFSLTDQALTPEVGEASNIGESSRAAEGSVDDSTRLAEQVQVLQDSREQGDTFAPGAGIPTGAYGDYIVPSDATTDETSSDDYFADHGRAADVPPNQLVYHDVVSGDVVHSDVVHSAEHSQDSERDDRLGTTYELLALNKRLREELKSAREERDWLRTRLEKLEARTERDQMLLLAESQTIRQLVTQVEKEKRSIWTLLALPWSGSQNK